MMLVSWAKSTARARVSAICAASRADSGPCGQSLGQRAALHEGHREERPPGALADLVDLDDVLMIQRRGGLGLRPEAAAVLRVEQMPRECHLQGHAPLEPELIGLVDDGHPAGAQLADHLVSRYRREAIGQGRSLAGRGDHRAGGRRFLPFTAIVTAPRLFGDGLQGPMEADLDLERLGEPREPAREFARLGRLSGRLAEQELIVDQVQSQLGIAAERREPLQVPLRGNGGRGPRPIPLVGAEDRGELGRLEILLARRNASRSGRFPSFQSPR